MNGGGASIASVGLQTYAALLKSQGVASADQFQAQKLESSATYGELKAVQTGGQMTRNLNTALGNIAAVRAAAGADPNSPTGAAIRDNQEQIGNEQKGIAVNSILAQATQDRNDAAYYKSAADNALLAGDVSAAAGIFGAVTPLMGSKSPTGGTGLSLTNTGGLY
jgi:hypothetical protein